MGARAMPVPMDPLLAISWQLWFHAATGMLVAWFLVPLGIGLARVGSDRHKHVQLAAISVLAASVGAAFWGKRQNEAPVHALLGIGLLMYVVTQVGVGFSMTKMHRGDAGRQQVIGLHRTNGILVALALIFLQVPLGFVTLFQLCAQETPCLGHFAAALALVSVAAAYYAIPEIATPPSAAVRYDVYAAENGIVSVFGVAVMMFSYYAGDLWSESFGAAVALVAAGSLYHLRHLHRTTAPISLYLLRGMPVFAVFVGAATVFALKPQVNAYGTAMHCFFAGQMAVAGLLRICLLWRAVAMTLCSSAIVFIGAQRDFQLLYASYYAERTSVATVVFTASLVGAMFFGFAHVWWLNFGKRAEKLEDSDGDMTYRIEVLLRE